MMNKFIRKLYIKRACFCFFFIMTFASNPVLTLKHVQRSRSPSLTLSTNRELTAFGFVRLSSEALAISVIPLPISFIIFQFYGRFGAYTVFAAGENSCGVLGDIL